jgi:hypothetical protein
VADTRGNTENLFFDEVVRSYVEVNRRFARREWLAAVVEKHLDVAGRSFVLLTAEPGAGKSAFMAQLAHDHPAWLRYFIRRDQRTVLADVSAKTLLLRIGYQLAASQPGLFSRQQVILSIKQRIGEVADRSELVGAEITRLIASPFYQRVLHIEQNVRINQGRTVGLRVEELVTDTRLLTEEDLLHLALLDPARALERADPTQRIVVLIDVLDEIRYHTTGENILNWLTNCQALPTNVRFVLTSRSPDQPLNVFCAKQEPNLTKLTISVENVEVRQDVKDFVAGFLNEEPVARCLRLGGKNSKEFAQELLTKAAGNLGYLDAIARGLDQAITSHDPRKVQALLSLKELPTDLEGLYAFFLQQIKSVVARERIEVIDPQTGERYDKDAWPAIYAPILGVLAIAVEPLSAQGIEELGQIRAERPWTIQAFERLSQFLDVSNNCYRFYHASVAEFLTDPRTGANVERAALYQDASRWHLRISEHYWRCRGDWSRSDDYGLNNLALHLAASAQVEKLLTLLDKEWMEERYERSGHSYHGFLEDIGFAETLLTTDDEFNLAHFMRLASMKHVVRELSTNLGDDDLQTLVFLKRGAEALDHARLRRTTVEQCLGILQIHRAMLEMACGNEMVLQEALRLAEAVPDASDRAAVLLQVAETWGREGTLAAESIFASAKKSILAIEDPQRRWDRLGDATLGLSRCGFFDEAERCLGNSASTLIWWATPKHLGTL